MVRKICLDSDVIIGLLNKDEAAFRVMASLDAAFYTTSINLFEVWFGRKEQETVFQLFESLEIRDFDSQSSRLAADMLRELKKRGQQLEVKDIFIAATCIRNNLELLTYNKKHFERLKQFGLILI